MKKQRRMGRVRPSLQSNLRCARHMHICSYGKDTTIYAHDIHVALPRHA